jgi:hypothetical protein
MTWWNSANNALSRAEGFAQRRVHFNLFTAANKSLLSKPIHERINSWSRGPHHFCQDCIGLVRYLYATPTLLAQVRKPQQHVSQPLFRSGGQQVSHVVSIVLDVGK